MTLDEQTEQTAADGVSGSRRCQVSHSKAPKQKQTVKADGTKADGGKQTVSGLTFQHLSRRCQSRRCQVSHSNIWKADCVMSSRRCHKQTVSGLTFQH